MSLLFIFIIHMFRITESLKLWFWVTLKKKTFRVEGNSDNVDSSKCPSVKPGTQKRMSKWVRMILYVVDEKRCIRRRRLWTGVSLLVQGSGQNIINYDRREYKPGTCLALLARASQNVALIFMPRPKTSHASVAARWVDVSVWKKLLDSFGLFLMNTEIIGKQAIPAILHIYGGSRFILRVGLTFNYFRELYY